MRTYCMTGGALRCCNGRGGLCGTKTDGVQVQMRCPPVGTPDGEWADCPWDEEASNIAVGRGLGVGEGTCFLTFVGTRQEFPKAVGRVAFPRRVWPSAVERRQGVPGYECSNGCRRRDWPAAEETCSVAAQGGGHLMVLQKYARADDCSRRAHA